MGGQPRRSDDLARRSEQSADAAHDPGCRPARKYRRRSGRSVGGRQPGDEQCPRGPRRSRVQHVWQRRADRYRRPDRAVAIATQGSSVWVAPSTGELTRLDGTTGKRVWQVDPNASPAGIATGEGAIWLTDPEAGNVVRVDRSGLLTPIPVGNTPTGIAVGGDGVWVADSLDDAVVRIDPDTRSPTAMIPVGRSPAGVAYGARVAVGRRQRRRHRDQDRSSRLQGAGHDHGRGQSAGDHDRGRDSLGNSRRAVDPTKSRRAPDGGTLRIVASSDVPPWTRQQTWAAGSLPHSCTRPALSF